MNNNNNNKTFIRNYGRTTVKLSLVNTELRITRLPEIDHTLNESNDSDQLCYAYLKEIVTPEAIGWDEGESDEIIDECVANSGFESEKYVVSEYIGREGQSDNNSPDIAGDGFLNNELQRVLMELDNDEEIYRAIMSNHAENLLISNK